MPGAPPARHTPSHGAPGGHAGAQAGRPHFQANRGIEDETEVRNKAYLALRAAFEGPDFESDHEFSYLTEVRCVDFEAFRERMIAVDARRRTKVAVREAGLRAAFEANAERRDGKFTLDQPIRLNLMVRT